MNSAAALGILAMIALWVRVGMAFYQFGIVRAKNSAGSVLRAVADLCVGSLGFWALGGAILFSGSSNGVFGIHSSLVFGADDVDVAAGVLALLAAVLIAGGIVTGAAAERAHFVPMLVVSAVISGLIVPVAGLWVWGDGWLHRLGFHDAGGASVVHLVGGVCAVVAVKFIGPREGKYNRDGSSNAIPGHNVPMAAAGVLIMFVTWGAYLVAVVGATSARLDISLLPHVVMNVLLAGGAAGIASLVWCQFRFGKADAFLMYGGVVGGLVAISGAADLAGTRFAVLVGMVAGVVVPYLMVALDLRGRLDDPAGGIAIHAGGGVIGTLAAGFVGHATFGMRMKILGVQGLGLLAIAALAIGLSMGLFFVLKKVTRLRAREADEFDGLDLAEHDIGAYPDFQQTMIKSYHLREM